MQHEGAHVDQARLELARLCIGITVGPFAGVFGSPAAVLRVFSPTARIINFPERRSELAKIRAEIEELLRTFRCGEAV